jgi:Autophagy-related protein 27
MDDNHVLLCLCLQADSSVFLVIAAYVIYSAFLNYSRYGAGTGWDLIPHSDTLREMYPPFAAILITDRI